jgi:hypothetical protein
MVTEGCQGSGIIAVSRDFTVPGITTKLLDTDLSTTTHSLVTKLDSYFFVQAIALW